jgi:hypothetical protein
MFADTDRPHSGVLELVLERRRLSISFPRHGTRLTAREIANLSVVHPSATEVLVRILREHFCGRERKQIYS